MSKHTEAAGGRSRVAIRTAFIAGMQAYWSYQQWPLTEREIDQAWREFCVTAPEAHHPAHDCEAWAMEGIGCANCNPIARSAQMNHHSSEGLDPMSQQGHEQEKPLGADAAAVDSARSAELPVTGKWQPIDTAPLIEWGAAAVETLVWGAEVGVHRGSIGRFGNYVFATVAHVAGNSAHVLITHWMPLPQPPVIETETQPLSEASPTVPSEAP